MKYGDLMVTYKWMVAVLWPIGRHLSASIFHTALLVVGGAGVYFGALLAIKDEFFLSNVKMVLKSHFSQFH